MRSQYQNPKRDFSQRTPEIASMVHIETRRNPEWSFPLHVHENELEFSLILDGKGHLYYDKEFFSIQSGDLIIKQTGVLHAEKTDPSQPLEQICVTVSPSDGEDYGFLLNQPALPVILTKSLFPLLREQLLFLLDHYQDEDSEDREAAHLVWLSALSLIEALLSKESGRREKASEPSEITPVIEYIDNNFNKSLSLQSLAENFFMSSGYLSKQFKKATGYSVSQYIINRRMGEAERLLLFEDRSVKEIALKCGFKDITYFYRTFKKYTRCTPLDFRKSIVQKSDR